MYKQEGFMKTYYVNADGIDVVVTQNSDGIQHSEHIPWSWDRPGNPPMSRLCLLESLLVEKTIAENVLKWGQVG